MAIVLIGVPGAGKSTVGKLLAEELKLDFIDTDQVIEQQAGKSISDIFIQDGEAVFRKIEKQVIAQALQADDVVVSLGGGALIDEETRQSVKQRKAIWLQAGLTQAVDRVGMNRNRPLLLGNVRGQLADLMAAREPLYVECAWFAVDTNELNPSQVVEVIVEELNKVNYANN